MPRKKKGNEIASLYQIDQEELWGSTEKDSAPNSGQLVSSSEKSVEKEKSEKPVLDFSEKLALLYDEQSKVKTALEQKIMELSEKLVKATSSSRVEKLEEQLSVAMKKLEEYHSSLEAERNDYREKKANMERKVSNAISQVASGQANMSFIPRLPFSM